MMDKARGPGLVSRVAVGPAAGWCFGRGGLRARPIEAVRERPNKRKVHMAHKLSTKLRNHMKEQTAYTAEKLN